MRKFFLPVIALFLFTNFTYSQITYTWTGPATGGDYQLATNWSPTRSVLATTDILQFDVLALPVVVSNTPNQTIGGIKINSGTLSVGFETNNPANILTLSGANPLIFSTPGSVLASTLLSIRLNSSASLTSGTFGIEAGTGGKIIINSALTVNGGTLNVDVPGTGGTSVTTSGSITYISGVFSSANKGSLIFDDGANYYHSANGSFVSAIPAATWNGSPALGSTCTINGLNAGSIMPNGFDSVDFYNFVWNCPAQNGDVVVTMPSRDIAIFGKFSVLNSNGKYIRLSSATTGSISVNNYLQTGGNLMVQESSGINRINVKADFIHNGGIIDFAGGTSSGTGLFDFKGTVTKSATWQSSSSNTNSQMVVQFSGNTAQSVTTSGMWTAPAQGVCNIVNVNTQTPSGVVLNAGSVLYVYNTNSASQASCTMGGRFTPVDIAAKINYNGTGAGGFSLVYNGSFFQTATTAEFPATNGPGNLIINNTLGVQFPAAFSRTIPGKLSMLSGNLAIEPGNVLSLTNSSLLNQLSYSGGYITTGTLNRTYPSAGLPTDTTDARSLFPFGSGNNNRSLRLFFSSSSISTGGVVSVSHDALVNATPISFIDNALTLDKRSNSKWLIATSGGFTLGATTASLHTTAANIGTVLNINELRLTDGIASYGTLLPTTGTIESPVVGKSGLVLADLNKPVYIGSSVVNPLVIITFTWTGIVSDNWTNPANWTVSSGGTNYPSSPTENAIINISPVPNQPKIYTGTSVSVYQLTVGAANTLTMQASSSLNVFDANSFSGTSNFDKLSTFGYASSGNAQNVKGSPITYGSLALSGNAQKIFPSSLTVTGAYTISGANPDVDANLNTFIYGGDGAQNILPTRYYNLTLTGNRLGNMVTLGFPSFPSTVEIANNFDVSGLTNFIHAPSTPFPSFTTVYFSGGLDQFVPGFKYPADILFADLAKKFDPLGSTDPTHIIYCRSMKRGTQAGSYKVTGSKVVYEVAGLKNVTFFAYDIFNDWEITGNLNNFTLNFNDGPIRINGKFKCSVTNFKQVSNNGTYFLFIGGGGTSGAGSLDQTIFGSKAVAATNTPNFFYPNIIVYGGTRNVTLQNTDTIYVTGTFQVPRTADYTSTGLSSTIKPFAAGKGFITNGSTMQFSRGSGLLPELLTVAPENNYNNVVVSGGSRAVEGSNITLGGNLVVSGAETNPVTLTSPAVLNVGDGNTARTFNVLGDVTVSGTAASSTVTGQLDLNTGTSGSTTLNVGGALAISGRGQIFSTGNNNGNVVFRGIGTHTYNNTSSFVNGFVNFRIGDGVIPNTKLTLLSNLSVTRSTLAPTVGTITVLPADTLDCGTFNITSNLYNGTSGNAAFDLQAGSGLITANTGGVEGAATSSVNGTIINDATVARTYSPTASYTFNAAANTNTSFPASPATFPMANLTFGNNTNAATFTLNKSIAISNALTMKSIATFELSASDVTLTSTATNTAKVAEVPSNANITYSGAGRVNVERYYPARRAWRLVTAPLSETGTVYSTWQNSGVYAPGIGTYITGNPVANGLDASPENNSSLKMGSALTPVLSPNTTLLSTSTGNADNKPFFIFVRGDRSNSNFFVPNSNNTTLSSRGKLQLFNHSFTASSIAGGLAMIGNPYASPVDFFKATRNNLLNKFYVWDPKLGSQGGYITFDDTDNNDGVYTQSVPSPSGLSNILQSSQAFIVETATAGAASLVFNESNKSITNNVNAFRPASQPQSFRTLLHQLEADNSTILTDGFLVEFDNRYSQEVTPMDAAKVTNVNEMLGVLKGSSNLSISRRPGFAADDTLFLSFKKAKQRNYRMELQPVNLGETLTAFIDDNYTGKQTPLSLSTATAYDFTVNGDAKSSAANRFKIVFKDAISSTLPVTLKNIKAYQQAGGIQVEWTVENEINISKYEVERSENGTSFTKVFTTPAKATGSVSSTYKFTDAAPIKGNNFYRILYYNQDGSFEYSRIVLVNIGKAAAGMSVYPNPVTGNTIGLSFNSMEKGIYSVRLVNTSGQVLMTRQLNHSAGSSVETLSPESKLVRGVYQLEVYSPGQKVNTLKVVVQ